MYRMKKQHHPIVADSRTQRLITLFDSVLKGEKTVASNNPKLFLEAICAQPSAVSSISCLVVSQEGLEALLLALSSDDSPSFLNGQLTTFLEYIKAPELRTVCGGSVLRQILDKLMEVPLMWETLVQAVRDQVLEQRALSTFAWLLIQLLSFPMEEAIVHLPVAQDPAIRKTLTSSSDDVKAQGQRIGRIVSTLVGSLTPEQRKDVQRGPGGRHDNDFAEIHKIGIYPSSEELQLGTGDVYLPRASDVAQRGQDSDGLASHIDGQFRLLRENMLCDLREELAASAEPKKWRRKPFEIRNLALVGVHCDERFSWSLKFICKYGLPQFRNRKPRYCEEFLKDNPKFLKHGSPVCLFVNEKFMTLGTIVREEDLLLRSPSILCVHVPTTDVQKVLMQLKVAGPVIRLVYTDTAIFTYEPVLKQLVRTRELSLAPEIVTWQAGTSIPPPDYASNGTMSKLLQDLSNDYSADLQLRLQLPEQTRLDKAQAECFRAALRQRVVLIQGPPGTGKSFIGSLVGKVIHQSTVEKILVVCFTHHALDDFLEHLLSLGIPSHDIVRLGSTHKATPLTKPLGLKEHAQMVRFTREQYRIFKARKQVVTSHAIDLTKAVSRFMRFNPRIRNQRDLLEFLESHEDGRLFFNAFKVPEQEDDMKVVGLDGKELDEYYLVDRWMRGKDAGIFASQMSRDCCNVWQMEREERTQKYQQWYQEMTKEVLAQVDRAGKLYNHAVEKVDAVDLEKDLTVMRNKRIIACTTTAAAKYSDIIRCISPGVVLVEEAGEILESHVLTALGPETKHLILIGDHKQLRPKVNYELSVEKGTGFDLNRSLFERLILKGFPYQTLFSQHRMRPEISALVRAMTYPELEDAKETQDRPNLRGFSDNIIFVNHKESESEFAGTREFGDSKATSSKQNQFEAKMTLKCVRYLAQQGYGSDDIVVLTPYLGQLRLLHDELKVDNDPVLNDLDSHDLVRAGLMPKITAEDNKPRLRISTIDNFQGEEANVVVASLCRSNIDNDIGFMSAPERLNVLISRARDAMILIGNAEHFTGSRKGGDLWKRFIGLLKAGMHVYDGFPVRCERHPDRTAILQKPADFDTECPDGGCKEPCGKMLNCGEHKCPDRCHLLSNHSKMMCYAVVSSECEKGHVYTAECHAKEVCAICEIEAKKAQEEAERKVRALEKEQEHVFQMAELDREIEAIMTGTNLKPFAKNAPNQTAVQATQPLLRANIQYRNLTFSIVQEVGSQIMEAATVEEVQDSARTKISEDGDPTAALKDHDEGTQAEFQLQEEELMRMQQEFNIVEQQMVKVKERSCAKTEEESRLEQELQSARIQAIKLKREMVALLRRRFEPTKSQALKQRLSEADESSPAKAERARIRAIKLKRAKDAKERRVNALRDSQPWRHKEVSAFSQRRSRTDQTQFRSWQTLGDSEEGSEAKAERANFQATKFRRARDAKEHGINAPQEVQLWRHRNPSAFSQPRFKTALTEVRSRQTVDDREKGSHAKAERVNFQGMKFKRAGDVKERSMNARLDPQHWRQQELPTHLQWRLKTAQTQVRSQQKSGASESSSEAKVKRAMSYTMKVKHVQGVKERSANVLRVAQLRERKEERQAEKKLGDFGASTASAELLSSHQAEGSPFVFDVTFDF